MLYMSEPGEGQPRPAEERKLRPEELKPAITKLREKFDEAFDRSRKLPLWHNSLSSSTLDSSPTPEYNSENELWRISRDDNSLFFKREINTDNGMEREEADLRNDERVTLLSYQKFAPDENDPSQRTVFYTENSSLTVELVEKLIAKLPQ